MHIIFFPSDGLNHICPNHRWGKCSSDSPDDAFFPHSDSNLIETNRTGKDFPNTVKLEPLLGKDSGERQESWVKQVSCSVP